MDKEETKEQVTLDVDEVEANEKAAYHVGHVKGMIDIFSIMKDDKKIGFRKGLVTGGALTLGAFGVGMALRHFGIVK